MVSVIIPTYKRAEFIVRAIDSVLNQTYKDIEIIIVDDNESGSNDRKNLENIMKGYESCENVKYIQHTENKNGAAARNTGILNSKGEYITFLDDDDFFLVNRISELVDLLDNNLEYGAAYTSVVTMCNSKIMNTTRAVKDGNLMHEVLMQNSFFKTGSNMFFRASTIKEIGDFDVSFLRHQDLEFMVRFFRKYKIKSLDSFTVVKDNSSRINFPNEEKAIKMRELFLETFKDDISTFSDSKDIWFKNYEDLLSIIQKVEYRNYVLEKIKQYGNYEKKSRNIYRKVLNKIPFLKKIIKRSYGIVKSKNIPKNIKIEIKEIIKKYKLS